MDGPLAQPAELAAAAFAGVAVARSALPAFRKTLNSTHGLSASLLKYAEEQTVLSLAAVLSAIGDFGLAGRPFTDWGAVSGPCFPGRELLAKHLDKVAIQGALGASPLIPAYLSLHAVSGTISQALHLHGPNLGVGGGRDNMVQALLIGLAMQQEQALPGVWVTVSGWDPEPIPEDVTQEPEPICRAVAVALTPAAEHHQGLKLRLVANADNRESHSASIAELIDFLTASRNANPSRPWTCALVGNAYLELSSSASATEARSARAA